MTIRILHLVLLDFSLATTSPLSEAKLPEAVEVSPQLAAAAALPVTSP